MARNLLKLMRKACSISIKKGYFQSSLTAESQGHQLNTICHS
jgi:hypothetical protein